MNCLLGEEMHELSSNAGHHTYIFFLGFHPSFWQEHFGVVDKLERRCSLQNSQYQCQIRLFTALLQRCWLLQSLGRENNCCSVVFVITTIQFRFLGLKRLPTSGLCCIVIWQRTATVPVGRICPPTSRSCSRTLKEGNQLFSLFSRL